MSYTAMRIIRVPQNFPDLEGLAIALLRVVLKMGKEKVVTNMWGYAGQSGNCSQKLKIKRLLQLRTNLSYIP